MASVLMVGLVLYGLGVDGRPGESVVGVPDQTHRVDRLFHQMLVDNLSGFLLSNGFPGEFVKSCVDWGEQGERTSCLNSFHQTGSFNSHLECRETGVKMPVEPAGLMETVETG